MTTAELGQQRAILAKQLADIDNKLNAESAELLAKHVWLSERLESFGYYELNQLMHFIAVQSGVNDEARVAINEKVVELGDQLAGYKDELSQVDAQIERFLANMELDKIANDDVTASFNDKITAGSIDWDKLRAWIATHEEVIIKDGKGKEVTVRGADIVKKDINSLTFAKLVDGGVIPEGLEVVTFKKLGFRKK